MSPLEHRLRHLDHLASLGDQGQITASVASAPGLPAVDERSRLNACIARQLRIGWRVPVAIGAVLGALLIGYGNQHDTHAPPAFLGLIWGGTLGLMASMLQTRSRVARWRAERDALPVVGPFEIWMTPPSLPSSCGRHAK